MTSLNQNTGLAFINTETNGGTITLPNSLLQAGRIVTFKDSTGSFQISSFILATQSGDSIDSSPSTIQTTSFGWTTLAAGTANQWYVTGGTQLTMMTTSTLNVSSIQANTINVSTFLTNTLTFQDIISPSYTMTLFPSSTSLYISTPSTTLAVAGGPRQSFGTLFLQVRP